MNWISDEDYNRIVGMIDELKDEEVPRISENSLWIPYENDDYIAEYSPEKIGDMVNLSTQGDDNEEMVKLLVALAFKYRRKKELSDKQTVEMDEKKGDLPDFIYVF